MTPRFPPAGPDGHGSPPSAVLSGRYDFLLLHVLRLIVFASRLRGCLPGSCPPSGGAPAAVQARRRTGVWISCWHSLSRFFICPRAKSRISQVPWRSIPVTLRRSTTPDDPLRLAASGASGAAPTHLTMKASSVYGFRGFLRRFITRCLRFTAGVAARHARLASGWRAAPLPGGSRTRWIASERFQLMASSFPGLRLAQ